MRTDAGRLMIETLASHGHRRIAFVIWDVNLPGFQSVEASVRNYWEQASDSATDNPAGVWLLF